MLNQQLANEFHTPIIEKLKKKRVNSSFIDNNWGADLSDMQLIWKFNKGARFLSCVIDLFNKYACIISLKDKKYISIANAFQKVLNKSNRKTNEICVNKGSKFYSSSF